MRYEKSNSKNSTLNKANTIIKHKNHENNKIKKQFITEMKTHRTEFDETKDKEINNSHIFRSKNKEIFDFQTKKCNSVVRRIETEEEEEERETLEVVVKVGGVFVQT